MNERLTPLSTSCFATINTAYNLVSDSYFFSSDQITIFNYKINEAIIYGVKIISDFSIKNRLNSFIAIFYEAQTTICN